MRSARHDRFGDPADVIEAAESPLPEPGPGEIRLRMALAPIHNHDLWTVRGQYGWKPTLPAIGGSEACGTIDALGEGVEGLAADQRVNIASAHGTWAEYFVAPAALAVPLPDAIDDAVGAQLVAMPLSALMLLDSLDLQPGQWIVQNAANGAVGKALAMLAAARGVRVLSLVRREAGVDELAAVGVGDAIACVGAAWRERARALLGQARARVAIDSVGGAATADLVALLGNGGTLVSFGAMGGEPMHVPSGEVIFRDLVVRGFWGSRTGRALPADVRRRLVGELLQRAASGELRLPVGAVFPLAQARDAMAASQRPGRGGKVLLRP